MNNTLPQTGFELGVTVLVRSERSYKRERDVIKLNMSLAWRLVVGENVYQAVR